MTNILKSAAQWLTPVLGRHWPDFWLTAILPYWFRSGPRRLPSRQRDYLATVTRKTTQYRQRKIRYFITGKGPVILLIHGWSGRASQFWRLADALSNAGFTVVGYDAAGHGDSDGNQTDLLEYTELITHFATLFGPLYGAVAHSFGVLCLTTALCEGLACQRVVLAAGCPDYRRLADRFARQWRMPERLKHAFLARLEQRFGTDVWRRYDIFANATRLAHIKAVIIHDRRDPLVPFDVAQRLHQAWPHSRLSPVSGCGHNRLLESEVFIRETIEHFTASGIPG